MVRSKANKKQELRHKNEAPQKNTSNEPPKGLFKNISRLTELTPKRNSPHKGQFTRKPDHSNATIHRHESKIGGPKIRPKKGSPKMGIQLQQFTGINSKEEVRKEEAPPRAGFFVSFLAGRSVGVLYIYIYIPPTPNTHFFLGYHVDPPTKKGGMYRGKPGYSKNTLKKAGIWSKGYALRLRPVSAGFEHFGLQKARGADLLSADLAVAGETKRNLKPQNSN